MNKLPASVAKIMAEEVKKATAAKSAAEAQKAELQKAAAVKAASSKTPTGNGGNDMMGAGNWIRDAAKVITQQQPASSQKPAGGFGTAAKVAADAVKSLPPNMAAPQPVTPPGAFGSRNGPSSGFGGIPLQQANSAPGPTTPPGAFGVRNVPGRNTSGGFKKGGKIKSKSSYSSGGKVSSASKRADGIATKGKTKGRIV